jgi:ABC-type cobalamin transport system permease subunit
MTPGMIAMIRCGENSLPIYCLSVLIAFIGDVVLKQIYSGFAMQVAVSFTGIALMIAAATVMTWTAKLDRRGPKLF